MAQSGVITFKGNPMTLAGEALKVGDVAPDFEFTTEQTANRRVQTLV